MPPKKFVPRVRKQGALRRLEANAPPSTSADSNAVEIIPVSKDKREARRQQLREEIRARQPESKASSKKKKRLEKYIDTKLKKEENLDLLKKLAQTKVDTSLFKSAKKLGRGSESKREKLGRILQEQRAGIGGDETGDILFETREAPDLSRLGEQNSSDEEQSIPQATPAAFPAIPAPSAKPATTVPASTAFGSGLKRPLETDDSGIPILKKRQRLRPQPKIVEVVPAPAVSDDDWEGFSSAEDDHEQLDVGQSDEENSNDDLSMSAQESDTNTDSESELDEEEDEESSSATSEDDEPMTEEAKQQAKERASSFKAWATQQRNEALGFTPSTNIDVNVSTVSNGEPKAIQKGSSVSSSQPQDAVKPKITPVVVPSTVRHVYNVPVTRSEAIQEVRSALPVVAEEQKIMEVIHSHDIVILWGATGSGKTTQVPQFLFEAGYGSPTGPTPGLIGVTQPRRVAAVSMAKRVAVELGDYKDKVGYQIRFDSSVGAKTAIKFMTDGVLLREISQDFLLSKYSAIVLDEAHERSVNTDLLMGMLSRIVETRAEMAKKNSSNFKPLKLVIMSATLSTAELTGNVFLFRKGIPPIVQAEGRQHPVTVHFARRTQREYLDEVFAKVSRGHRKLPPGGFLVFLTGQNEIAALARRLKDTFTSTDGSWKSNTNIRVSAADASIEDEDIEFNTQNHSQVKYDDPDSDSDAEIYGVDNDEEKEFDIGEQPPSILNVHILPLYSQLPTDQQMRIFQPPPDGSRLIVLATNVAETSLTIPGIKYVFDCGRAKQKRYNTLTGVQSFEVGWISKASASQRAGRAGRTGPGHCYRLYSSAVYERDFAEFADPEITRVPVEGVVLQLKSMGIPNVASFPFPTPPNRESLVKAEKLLSYLGAITEGKVTQIGRQLSLYPLSPRLSRILVQAQAAQAIDAAITLVAALAVPDIFIPESQLDIAEPPPAVEGTYTPWNESDNIAALARDKRRKEYNSFHASMSRLDRSSDAMKLLTTISDFSNTHTSELTAFNTFTRTKALQEILQLRRQLSTIVASHNPGSVPSNPPTLIALPNPKTVKALRSVVAAGYIDQIAIRADLSPTPPESGRKPKRATEVAYITLFPSTLREDGRSVYDETDPRVIARRKYVYIHPSSLLSHTGPDKLPQYLTYTHLSQASPSTVTSAESTTLPPRTRLHPLTPLTSSQIAELAKGTPLLEDGKPIGRIEGMERDERGRERRCVTVVKFLRGGEGAGGWPLPPARRCVQVRVTGRGWVGEEDVL